MQCSACNRAMTQLFFSLACDHCDYGVPEGELHRGFIVHRPDVNPCGEQEGLPLEEYVFRTAMDADRWRTAAGREGCEIREVWSLNPYRWHLSRGTLRDVVIADHLFEIYPNHRYEPLNHRAFLGKEPEKKR